MEHKKRIEAILARAGRVNLPIADLASAASISKATIWRWRQDDANPRMRSMLRALDAMEARLDAEEQRLVAELQLSKHGAAA